jgi:hypothetical protein
MQVRHLVAYLPVLSEEVLIELYTLMDLEDERFPIQTLSIQATAFVMAWIWGICHSIHVAYIPESALGLLMVSAIRFKSISSKTPASAGVFLYT